MMAATGGEMRYSNTRSTQRDTCVKCLTVSLWRRRIAFGVRCRMRVLGPAELKEEGLEMVAAVGQAAAVRNQQPAAAAACFFAAAVLRVAKLPHGLIGTCCVHMHIAHAHRTCRTCTCSLPAHDADGPGKGSAAAGVGVARQRSRRRPGAPAAGGWPMHQIRTILQHDGPNRLAEWAAHVAEVAVAHPLHTGR